MTSRLSIAATAYIVRRKDEDSDDKQPLHCYAACSQTNSGMRPTQWVLWEDWCLSKLVHIDDRYSVH